jgi:5-methylcytosine-specific restriction endonuclease McrA
MDDKKCSECGEWKSVTEFHIDKNSKSGRMSKCKSCRNKREKILRKQRIKLHPNYIIGNLQKCSKCGEDKPLHEFSADKNYEMGIGTRCKECMKKYKRKWKSENKIKYQIKNRDYINKRQKMIKLASNGITIRDKNKVLMLYDYSCALTGAKTKIQIDHIIPLVTGQSSNSFENILPLQSKLNESKHNRNVFEWAKEKHEYFGFTLSQFNKVMTEVALRNGMSLEEYRNYVYWCFENKIDIKEYSEVK